MKRSTIVLSGIGIILVACGILFFSYYTSRAQILHFAVQKPNFTATGKNLSKVQVWAIPTGTNVMPADYLLIDTMTEAGTKNGTQSFVAQIPKDPILVSDFFVKGFNKNGDVVGEISLPYKNPTALYTAIWGGGGQEAEVSGIIQGVSSQSKTITLNAGGLMGKISVALDSAVNIMNTSQTVLPFDSLIVGSNITMSGKYTSANTFIATKIIVNTTPNQ